MKITLSYAAPGLLALLSANFESTAAMVLSIGKPHEVIHHQRSTSKRAPSTMRPRATSDYISGGTVPTSRDASPPSQLEGDTPAGSTMRPSAITSPDRQSSYSYQWDQPFQMNSLQTPGVPSSTSPGASGLPLLGLGNGALPLGPGGLGSNLPPLGVGRLANALPIGGSDSGYGPSLGGALPSAIRNIAGPNDLLGLSSLSSPIARITESPANLPSSPNPEVPSPQQIDGTGFVNDNKIDGVLHHIKHVIAKNRIIPQAERPVNTPYSSTQQTTVTQVSPQTQEASSPIIMSLSPSPVRGASSPLSRDQPEGYISPVQQPTSDVTPVAARPILPSNNSSDQVQTPAQPIASQPPQEQVTPTPPSQPSGTSDQQLGPGVTPAATRPIALSTPTSERPQAMAQSPAAQPSPKEITSPISKKQPEEYVSAEQDLSPDVVSAAARPIVPVNSEHPQAIPQPPVEHPEQRKTASPTPQSLSDAYLSPAHVVTPVAVRPTVPSNMPGQPQAPAQTNTAQSPQNQVVPSVPVAQPVESHPAENAPLVPATESPIAKVHKLLDTYEKAPESSDSPVSQPTGRTNAPSPPISAGDQSEASPNTTPRQALPVSPLTGLPAREAQGKTAASSPADSPRDSYY